MFRRKIKFLIPKDRAELVPLFLTFFLICIYVIFELYVILPTIYHNVFTFKEILHLCIGMFVIYNLLGNLFFSLMTDTSIDTIICPVMLPSATVVSKLGNIKQQETLSRHCNWHFCYQCEVNVPPRTEHCHACKKCILKRDYHCPFLGRCLGFRNIRYYLCFLIWTWIGLIYCNALHLDYTYELVGSLSWRMLIAGFCPMGAWIFGLLDHFSFILSILCSISIILCIYVSFLTIQQIYLITNGQTWFEYQHNIHLYNHGIGFIGNLQLVLGKRWYWVIFSPSIVSSPIGDGMSFDTSPIEIHHSN